MLAKEESRRSRKGVDVNNAEGNKRKLDFNANRVSKCKDCEMMNLVSEDVCDFP